MPNIIDQRIDNLRKYLEDNNLHAFIVPSTDAHLSEYPASHWASRLWISGFTGSAGTMVVTRTKAALWTDSRYFIQAANQLKGTSIILQKEDLPNTPTILQWLASELAQGQNVGIDSCVYGAQEAFKLESQLSAKGLNLATEHDPFACIWDDRPAIPTNPIFVLPEKYAGESAKSKIARICDAVEEKGAKALLAASLDGVAWIFNIRGNDVKCNPVAVCFAYVSRKETILFIDPRKVEKEVADYLRQQGVTLAEYDKVFDYMANTKDAICLDSNKVTHKLYCSIPASVRKVDTLSPADLIKSMKNKTELEGIRNAMQRDGVALVHFLMWLEKAVPQGNVNEITVSEKLIEYRSQQDLYVGESFDTIAGYAANGAMVHYKAEVATASKIEGKGLLLVDSGAQYFDGTTDITRTIAMGETTQEEKEDYTLVLKGHIGIATAIYPQGTRGSQLDILARKALWNKGLNYLHGTGHGVGHFLNVHEGPQSIRLNENPTTLAIGMVTSNEPGMYRAGKHGIRIENLVATQQEMTGEFGDFYSFETLTLCPIDTNPIVKQLLTGEEKKWFNAYHKYVFERLSPLLNNEQNLWLKEKTNEI